jgi:hypothetical protein
MGSRRHLSIVEWTVIVMAAVVAVAFSEFAHISRKWENAVVYTVILFSTLLVVTHAWWNRGTYWQRLIAMFLLHCAILGGLTQSLPFTSAGPHGVPMIATVLIEGYIMAFVLMASVSSDSERL